MRSVSNRVMLLALVTGVSFAATAFADPEADFQQKGRAPEQHSSPPPQQSRPADPVRQAPPPQRSEPVRQTPPQRAPEPVQRAPEPVRQQPPPQQNRPVGNTPTHNNGGGSQAPARPPEQQRPPTQNNGGGRINTPPAQTPPNRNSGGEKTPPGQVNNGGGRTNTPPAQNNGGGKTPPPPVATRPGGEKTPPGQVNNGGGRTNTPPTQNNGGGKTPPPPVATHPGGEKTPPGQVNNGGGRTNTPPTQNNGGGKTPPPPVATRPGGEKTPPGQVNNGGGRNNPPGTPQKPPINTVIRNTPVSSRPGSFTPPVNRAGRPVGINPANAPKRGRQIEKPNRVVVHRQPSQLDNPRTVNNLRVANRQVTVIRNNVRITNIVNVNRTRIVNNYNPTVRARWGVVNNYYHDYGWRNYYHGYYHLGFYGGFYYPVRPCYDISPYLVYPALYWFYVSQPDPYYWSQWYPGYYESHPVEAWPYAEVYYPTETFRDLGMEVSAYPADRQYNFRHGMRVLTDALVSQISNNVGQSVTLNKNQVVVSHYQNLEDQAYVVEGFVDLDYLNLHVAYKAFLDLTHPDSSLVFVPTSDTPTPEDSAVLGMINQRIQNLGGNPFVADQEQDSSNAP